MVGAPITVFRLKFFSQFTIIFAEEQFFVSEVFPFRKYLWTREKVVARSYVNDISLTVPKLSVREPFVLSKIFEYGKILWIRGEGITRSSVDDFFA